MYRVSFEFRLGNNKITHGSCQCDDRETCDFLKKCIGMSLEEIVQQHGEIGKAICFDIVNMKNIAKKESGITQNCGWKLIDVCVYGPSFDERMGAVPDVRDEYKDLFRRYGIG